MKLVFLEKGEISIPNSKEFKFNTPEELEQTATDIIIANRHINITMIKDDDNNVIATFPVIQEKLFSVAKGYKLVNITWEEVKNANVEYKSELGPIENDIELTEIINDKLLVLSKGRSIISNEVVSENNMINIKGIFINDSIGYVKNLLVTQTDSGFYSLKSPLVLK